jgi:amidase
MTKGTSSQPDAEELWRWPTTRLAGAIKAGEVSSREVVTSCLDRIADVNPKVNALVSVDAEEALAAARVADDMVAAGQALGPLHGIPVATKINTDQAGRPTTDGVVAWADRIVPADSAQVANLRRAGAVFLGRSNSPAFAYRWFSNNDLHGRTNNPWDAGRTPGGSSGGAAAALASGMVPVAQGNDIGGSVRYPAYACGVVGLRPTVGRVAHNLVPPGMDAPLSAQLMSVDGPLARTVDDLRLAYAGLLGPDPRDPFHVPGRPVAGPARRPLRVGLVRSVGVAEPTPAVERGLDEAAGSLRAAGYEVDEVQLPLLAEAYRLWYLLCMEEFRQLMPLVERVGDEGMKRAAEGYFACAADWWGPAPGLADYMNGYARRGTLITQLQAFMEEYPIVLLPVSSEQAFEQDADIQSVAATRRCVEAQWSMMAIPVLGFPALSVPTGVAAGLPVGVQLLGRRFDEAALFDAAGAIEARAGVFTPVDPR